MNKKKNCIFCELISKKSTAITVDRNSFVIINDKKPDAKKHLLAIPKNHFESIYDAKEEDFETIKDIIKFIADSASELGVPDGCRLVLNNGEKATQTIFHAHIHILGGQQLKHMEKNNIE